MKDGWDEKLGGGWGGGQGGRKRGMRYSTFLPVQSLYILTPHVVCALFQAVSYIIFCSQTLCRVYGRYIFQPSSKHRGSLHILQRLKAIVRSNMEFRRIYLGPLQLGPHEKHITSNLLLDEIILLIKYTELMKEYTGVGQQISLYTYDVLLDMLLQYLHLNYNKGNVKAIVEFRILSGLLHSLEIHVFFLNMSRKIVSMYFCFVFLSEYLLVCRYFDP